MPNRILREGILTSERVNALGWPEEVFYRRLISVVDDFGRFYASSKLLRAACYPLHIDKVSDSDIGKWLTACVTAALVRVYPALDGKRYLEVQDFRQQQRAKESKFPQPQANASHVQSICTADAQQTHACAHLGEGGVVCGDGVVKPPTVVVETASPPRPPACPSEEVIALYHLHLPMLPRVDRFSEARRKVLSARWRDVVTDPDIRKTADVRTAGLDWFAWFFGRAATSQFLIGKAKDWRADFDFLMRESRFTKVIEGGYHKEAA